MATQSAFAHNRQSSAGSASVPFPLPASPTLTNPDMILPDYPDYDRAHSPDELPENRLTAWRNPSSSNHGFHLPMHNGFPAGPITPTTPIIYGNGTMLSDIGEVTEVESNAGHAPHRSSSRYSQFSDDGRDLQTPPAVAKVLAARRGQTAARRASIDSTSTIMTKEDAGNFTDFDDLVSVDDVSFQGDDEESMASSYVDDAARQRRRVAPRPPPIEPNTDRYSTTLLSKKAEEILANAKRRLTTMEGNLTRARSSLGSPVLSDDSTPSPPILRPATASHIPGHATMSRHSRNMSDISFQDKKGSSTQLTRSASALGAAGGYRQPVLSPRGSDGFRTGQSTPLYGISHHPLDTGLEPLGEDVLETESRRESMRMSIHTGASVDANSELGLSRSSSVAQVRDLQDQMNGLRGKISSLREQARADSLKRRSLQSMRTPSPFTHARWDQGYMEPRDIRSVNADAGAAPGPDKGENADVFVDAVIKPSYDDGGPVRDEPAPPATSRQEEQEETPVQANTADQVATVRPVHDSQADVPATEDDDMHTENGDVLDGNRVVDGLQEAAEIHADDASESGDSLYHEAYQAPISHEDREDAFDYEHFFLHSAMGTISHGRFGRRGGPGSVSSEESIETTRPITPSKRASLETISSVDTFATADEGRASRSSEYKAQQTVHPGGGLARSTSLNHSDSSDPRSSGEVSGITWDKRPRGISVLQQSVDASTKAMHRPSIASFESTGTTRSFPLVSPKAKAKGGNWTPNGSPDDDLKQVSDALIKETLSICDADSPTVGQQTPPLQLLGKEDRIYVDRLVASLGKCVLALGEASRASSEARAYRRRLDAARRILEGLDD